MGPTSVGGSSFVIYINVSSSSSSISSSAITLSVTGATSPGATLAAADTNGPATFTGGSDYVVTVTSGSSASSISFELIYKGNVIYNSAA